METNASKFKKEFTDVIKHGYNYLIKSMLESHVWSKAKLNMIEENNKIKFSIEVKFNPSANDIFAKNTIAMFIIKNLTLNNDCEIILEEIDNEKGGFKGYVFNPFDYKIKYKTKGIAGFIKNFFYNIKDAINTTIALKNYYYEQISKN